MKTPPSPSRVDSLIHKHTVSPNRNNKKELRELQNYFRSLEGVQGLTKKVQDRVGEVQKINYVKFISAPNNEPRNNYYDSLSSAAKNFLRKLMKIATSKASDGGHSLEMNDSEMVQSVAMTAISLSIISDYPDDSKERQNDVTKVVERLKAIDPGITTDEINKLVPYRHINIEKKSWFETVNPATVRVSQMIQFVHDELETIGRKKTGWKQATPTPRVGFFCIF